MITMEHGRRCPPQLLLESTRGTVHTSIELKAGHADGTTNSADLKSRLDVILGGYNEDWSSAADSLKSGPQRKSDKPKKALLANMVKGMVIDRKKLKS